MNLLFTVNLICNFVIGSVCLVVLHHELGQDIPWRLLRYVVFVILVAAAGNVVMQIKTVVDGHPIDVSVPETVMNFGIMSLSAWITRFFILRRPEIRGSLRTMRLNLIHHNHKKGHI